MSVIIDSDNNNVNITEEPINVTVSLGGPDVAAVWGGITGDITEQEDLQTALDDKVPYTGATGDVNLGEYGIQLGNLEFDNTPTNVPTAAGSVYWSDTDGTLNMVLKGGQTISRIGETQHIRALNNTGAQIARGKVVYVVGAQGQRLTIALADADTEILSKDTIGFTSEAIADGAEGFVIVQGVINNISTTGMSDGATVYLSQTAGGYTTTPPVDPAHLVVLGFIVNGGSGGAGSIYVKVDNGYELGELHDVNTTGATNGQVLTYNGTTWVADDPAAGGITSIATTAPITGGTITTSGTIGITQAGAAADGYLSSVDWSTFNNKQSALSLTTTGTSGAATLVGSTLNIPQYQEVLTNPVTGTGTSGQIAYWSGTGTQTGSSSLLYNNTNKSLQLINSTNSNPTRGLYLTQTTNDGASPTFIMQKSRSGVITTGTDIARIDGEGFDGTNYIKSTRINFSAAGTISTGVVPGSINFLTANTSGTLTLRSTINELGELIHSGNTSISGSAITPTARLHIRGSGTTSSTTALLVQNSTPSALLTLTDDGVFKFGSSNAPTQIFPFSAAFNTPLVDQRNLQLFSSVTTQAATLGAFYFTGLDFTQTANNQIFVNIGKGFAPTSGTATFANIVSSPTINQTGGANGITRGLYVNPTLTAAADWRSVETSNNTGWAVYTAGTANSYFGGNVGIGTTSPSYRLHNVGSAAFNNGASGDAINILNNGFIVMASTRVRGFSTTIQFQDSTFTDFVTFACANGSYNYFRESNGIGLTSGGSARLHVRGSGTTSATTALLVQNSTPSELFKITDDGVITTTGNLLIASTRYVGISSNNIRFSTLGGGNQIRIGYSGTGTGGELQLYNFSAGVERAFFYANGQAIISTIATTPSINASAAFQIESTTLGFLPPRMTTTQRDAIATPASGLILYNSTNSSVDLYTSAWRSLVSTSNYDGMDISFGTTTGTKIGTSTSQKIGLWNATPIVQPTTAVAAATRVGGGGTTVTDTDTFDGYTIAQIVKALRNIGALA